MPTLYAYIDEFGNNGLDFTNPQVSSHFIVTAIIVEENQVVPLEDLCHNIRKNIFKVRKLNQAKLERIKTGENLFCKIY